MTLLNRLKNRPIAPPADCDDAEFDAWLSADGGLSRAKEAVRLAAGTPFHFGTLRPEDLDAAAKLEALAGREGGDQ